MSMCCTLKAIKPNAGLDQRSTLVSVEKAWHGLHYLLTGSAMESASPLAFLLQGGEEVGEDDGYGAPRLFNHDEVRELDAALSATSDDDLWSRFDPEEMSEQGVYPDCWDEEEADLREEYLHYFHEIKGLVHRANVEKSGLLVSLT